MVVSTVLPSEPNANGQETTVDSGVPTVVLVHGSFHGAWCWNRVTERLRQRGVPSRAIDLPGRGKLAGMPSRFDLDVEALHDALREISGPSVLCGHGRAGQVITRGGDHPAVRHLVYLSAPMPDVGERTSILMREALGGGVLAAALRVAGSELVVDPVMARDIFYRDCAESDARWAVDRLVPEQIDTPSDQQVAEANDVCSNAAWKRIPSTYLVCENDPIFPAAIQRRMSSRASERMNLDCGYAPFLSAPRLIADLLEGIARRYN